MNETEIWALGVTAALIVLDYLTGFMKACMNHDISSRKLREGLWHKGGEVLVVALAEILERGQTHLDMGFTMPLVVPAAVYIIISEVTSILENLTEISPGLKDSPVVQLFRIEEKETK